MMIELGERLGVQRVCVHADHWAATATKRNAERERIALVTGCLVAAARAEAGSPVLPSHISPEATFHGMTLPERRRGPLGGCVLSISSPCPTCHDAGARRHLHRGMPTRPQSPAG